MKKIIAFLIFILPLVCFADDTIILQNMCNMGNVTLTRNYSISGQVTVTYLLHGAGFTINTSQTTGAAIILGSSGAAIDHTTIAGTWAYTSAPNSAANYAIAMKANNTTVTYCHILNFPGYGINCAGAISNLTVTHNLIEKLGYIGFYFDPEVSGTSASVFSDNTVDKSMLNPATAIQIAVGIRGQTTGSNLTSNWTIARDTLKMPHGTTSTTECIETRNMTSSTISGLICDGGSIGISVVKCTHMAIINNRVSANNNEGIEIGNVQYSHTLANTVTSTLGVGYLIDGGATPCFLDTLNNDTARVTGRIGMQLFSNTHDMLVSGPVITHTTQGIYCQTTNHITIRNARIDGGSHASTVGIYINGGLGRILMQRGGITHNTYAVYANNSTPGAVVDSVIGVSVNLTGTAIQFGNSFSNGAHYGAQVYFTSGALTFGTIPSKVYGVSPFSPGAVSSLPITYTSADLTKAIIVSGLIQVKGVGTVNIIASNGDTSAVQPLTVTKASLVITADSKTKIHGAINPTLTASYGGFVYGDTPSVVSGVTLATTAVTGSAPGTYPITASSGTASNYSLSYIPGVMTVISGRIGTILHKRIRYH